MLQVYVLDPATGAEKLITGLEQMAEDGPGNDFGWSPDGRIWAVTDVADVPQLHFFDAKSGEDRLFGKDFRQRYCSSAVEWSPDGRYMSYTTDTNDQYEGLTIYNLETQTGFTVPWIGQQFPYWSPDGNYMLILDNYFTLDDPNTEAKTRLIRAEDGSELLRRGTDVDAFNFAFSPDSRFFAYEKQQTAWLYELATGENINLEIPADFLKWSPTGRYLLTGAGEAGFPYAVPQFSYDREAGHLTPIDLPSPATSVTWTSDENIILLYTNYQPVGDSIAPQSLITYDLASGKIQTIFEMETTGTIDLTYRQSSWYVVPDWHIIPYSIMTENAEETNSQILFVNVKTGVKVELLQNSLELLAQSPDGHWLSLTTGDGVYLFDTLAGDLQGFPITGDPAKTYWSPDSHYLAFSQDEEQFALWNTEKASLETLPGVIIGWQYGREQNSLVCPGGYGDGNP
jgi:WD40 repeat protein